MIPDNFLNLTIFKILKILNPPFKGNDEIRSIKNEPVA
jgi:hypothetical protein